MSCSKVSRSSAITSVAPSGPGANGRPPRPAAQQCDLAEVLPAPVSVDVHLRAVRVLEEDLHLALRDDVQRVSLVALADDHGAGRVRLAP